MVTGTYGSKDILIKLKGDNKDFKTSMDDTDKSMGKFSKSIAKAGPAIAAAFAVGTAAFVGLAVKMAAAEEVVNRQTESILKAQGVMWDEVGGHVADYINELEALTAYGDTDLQMAFNRMASSGMKYTEVMKSMKMVTDIAYTRNMDLVASADLIAKAYNAQGSALKRYGIILEDGVEGAEALDAMQTAVNDNFADASDRTETLEGKMGLLKAQTDDVAEAFGDELLPALTEVLGKLIEVGDGSDSLATKIGKIVVSPYDFGKDITSMHTAAKAHGELRRAEIHTEEELLRWYSLRSNKLEDMSDEYFKHTMLVMKLYDFDEKAAQLMIARSYAIKMQNRELNEQKQLEADLLRIEKDITTEEEKQLTLIEKKAAHDKERTATSRVIGMGTGAASMSAATAALYESSYGVKISSERINPNISIKSGV